VVNPTEEGLSFAPKISGVKLSGQGKLHQIAPPALTSANEAGKEPVVKIVESAQEAVPETVLIPPISVSVYEFDHCLRMGTLLVRQNKSDILSHPFPQKTREWMGHPHCIWSPDQ
jgi:hypothetical protein